MYSTKLFSFVIRKIPILLYGILCTLLLALFVIISFRIYLYRYLITLLAKQIHPKRLGNPLTSLGSYFACEFLPSSLRHPPRSTIVATFVVDGKITLESTRELLKARWFGESCDFESNLKCERYPELQQYAESWMGFLFLKQDLKFQLDNHLKSHQIKGESDDEVENNLNTFMETLLNKSWHVGRSPWEIYIIDNYRSDHFSKQCENGEEGMTLIAFRFHHCLADGYSVLYAVLEDLLGTPLTTLSLPSAKDLSVNGLANKLIFWSVLTFKILYDLSHLFSLSFSPTTPWHFPDSKKSWRQLYGRSQPIPIQVIKSIKNRLGVSFTGVLLSAVSAGISRSINANLGKDKFVRSLPSCAARPLPDHPKKLINHLTNAILHLPTDPNLEPVERLMKTEKRIESAKRNTIPLIHPFIVTALGSHFAKVCNLISENRYVATGFSNFPGSATRLEWEKKKVLAGDAAAGANRGVAGVGFVVISFNDHVRISITAESAVMTRSDLKKLITHISDEIEMLYDKKFSFF